MKKRESKLLKTLRLADDLMLLFYDYFDRDIRKLPDLEDFLYAGVESTSSYFIKKGILNPDLTFRESPQSVLRLIKKPWDKKWRFVVFDIPQENRTIRDIIRRRLKEWGFKFFQRSIWFSPLPLTNKVKQLDKHIDDTDYLTIIEGTIFRCNPQKLVEEKWEINNWKTKAQNWCSQIKNKNKLTKESQIKFWNLIESHPKVPLDLLPPNWPLKKTFEFFANKKFKI